MAKGFGEGALALALMIAVPASAQPAAPAKWDLVTHNDVLIAAPPARVWPHILTLEWKMGPTLVGLPGDAHRYKAVMGGGEALFYVEDVELVAPRLRTIRLNEPDGTLLGYASLRLTPQGTATRVRYDVYSSLAMPSAADAAALRKESVTRFDRELRALKRIVEAGKGAK